MPTSRPAIEVRVPDPPSIAGLRFRRVDLDADVDGLVALINACSTADDTEMAFSADEIRHDFAHKANFDIDRDVVVAELDGRLVGEVEVNVVVRDGIAVHSVIGWVHPDARRRGIGRSLARWVEGRSREVAAAWPGPSRTSWARGSIRTSPTGSRCSSRGLPAHALRLHDDPAAVGADPGRAAAAGARDPAGRRGRPPADLGRRHGGVPRPPRRPERTEEHFQGWFTMPNLDTSLWRVAWDGDEVAGRSGRSSGPRRT
jgi:GNAT superfamily N-acetyltransferase